jgi:hypothetical protein
MHDRKTEFSFDQPHRKMYNTTGKSNNVHICQFFDILRYSNNGALNSNSTRGTVMFVCIRPILVLVTLRENRAIVTGRSLT